MAKVKNRYLVEGFILAILTQVSISVSVDSRNRNSMFQEISQITSNSSFANPSTSLTWDTPSLRKFPRNSTNTLTNNRSSVMNGSCDFETRCSWDGSTTGFRVATGTNALLSGPNTDADGNANGHFLYVQGDENTHNKSHMVLSQRFLETPKQCRLKFQFHGRNIGESKVVVLTRTSYHDLIIAEMEDTANNSWIPITVSVGRQTAPFQLVVEVLKGTHFPYHAALDNIVLENCFPNSVINRMCNDTGQFECEPGICVDRNRVCDINKDCKNGIDEKQKCDKQVSWNASCDFERDTCGWSNVPDDDYEWERKDGSMFTDHTYKNSSGHYMFLGVPKTTIGHHGILSSSIYPPPPRTNSDPYSPNYNSCQVRFYYRILGKSRCELLVRCVELKQHGASVKTTLWRHFGLQNTWQRVSVPLPPVTHRYKIEFLGTSSIQRIEHVAVDDVSLSPECFPTRYDFGTCGNSGPKGPSEEQCKKAYSNSELLVQVDANGPLAGIQQWTVPKTGLYSVFARGASGGMGTNNQRPSKGATALGVFNWTQGSTVYILVGQEGKSSHSEVPTSITSLRRGKWNLKKLSQRSKRSISDLKKIVMSPRQSGGGGGGGATYVFATGDSSYDSETGAEDFILHLVAGGGGGLSHNMKADGLNPDGRGADATVVPANGRGTPDGAGGGGGWNDKSLNGTFGKSLLEGATGGESCKLFGGNGGFGGGGGGCISGGGGGGYAGGDASLNDSWDENGLGGYSYASGLYSRTISGQWIGSGSVVIIPSLTSCDCDHLCVFVDLENSSYACLCEPDHILADDNITCLKNDTSSLSLEDHLIIVAVLVTAIFFLGVATFMFFLYQRFRRQMAQTTRQDQVNNPELQLNRLRQTTGGMITEYNPNYEFGGSACTLQDLKEVPRENLTLIKPLGQGAFGEVYQGTLSNFPGEIGDVPVAIKTLPELSASQSEMDFLMEALIMSKFSHPNIVRFIGVCFEKLPKFIVLELLPGGDLKSFLRESRSKPDKPSPLTTLDLLMLAIDVAKGCHYLEQNHFIHRDIAARNCLLTTKDISRMVKIADFGMARDIYRADYYRKGGKAMLPVKWMPPEAFLDGIFTTKTDVWSFGVLLWEVMSLGYMPYPGRGNQDVMQLVTSGGRLEPPSNCPQPIYHIMSHCWHPVPDERPNFATILERLGYCLQDPDVFNAPLPVFHRPPSTERDATVMRPPVEMDNVCLQVQRGDTEPQSPASTDYLIPIPSSNYSLCTEKTELQSASSMESVDHLLEMNDKRSPMSPDSVPSPLKPQAAPPTTAFNSKNQNNWETSFIQGLNEGSSPCGSDYQSTVRQGSVPAPPQCGGSTMATIPPPESSPARRSPPSAIARQRPSVMKPLVSSISPPTTTALPLGSTTEPEAVVSSSGRQAAVPNVPLPLDASFLVMQHQQQAQAMPYANIAMAPSGQQSSTDLSQRTMGPFEGPYNEPYTITAPRGAAPPSNKGKYDRDVKC